MIGKNHGDQDIYNQSLSNSAIYTINQLGLILTILKKMTSQFFD